MHLTPVCLCNPPEGSALALACDACCTIKNAFASDSAVLLVGGKSDDAVEMMRVQTIVGASG